ncbi:GTP 3',8-cyclase MoaA [Scrofimicrobium canadense]|uniref:GTP 3',8-cyclase MoaA n=1 Tax=Scrofimicrobium canadense TaxID=2652290 RepID=UPI00197EADC1|nr:GTP 3',8-cyclase MoaA [Scrofimicrobium canadense]
MTELVDSYGRVHRSMRISITDKCQLRCTYCMPAEGLPWIAKDDLLSPEEIYFLAKAAYSAGIREFRLTGGEPLIRPEVVDIVARLATLSTAEDPVDLSMTTNAVLLPRFAVRLKEAGLNRLNVSLDTLRPERFAKLTLRNSLEQVLDGLHAAKDAGFTPIKINTLIMPGVNDDEILDLTDFSLKNGYELRFIEHMPLGISAWDADTIVTQADILRELSQRYTLTEMPNRKSAPAARWRIDDGGTVGIIASVTNPFCGDCDRLRLSADGKMRTCLFSDDETDLRESLRNGADTQAILRIMALATLGKGPGHSVGQADYVRPKKGMSQIGG